MHTENKKRLESFREDVKTLKEYELFLYIEGFGGCSFREKHGANHRKLDISQKDLNNNLNYYTEMQKIALSEVIRRFRVNPTPKENWIQLSCFKEVPPKYSYSEWNYRKWYRFWKNWMEHFSDFWWDVISCKMTDKEDISRHLPTKEWDDVEKFSEEFMRDDAYDMTEKDIIMYTIEG